MILVDANILIYAYNPSSAHHSAAKKWLESAVLGPEPVRLTWASVLAFVRIMTNAQVFRRPMSLQEAVDIVEVWLAHPMVGVLGPGDRHWPILRALLLEGQATGPLAMDAHLAAIAVEHGATLVTTDRDFGRFAKVKTSNPLSAR